MSTPAEPHSTLPALLGEILADEPPSAELIQQIRSRIGNATVAEIHEGLHRLWPYTRHITREEWLKTLYFELQKAPSTQPLRLNVEQWMHAWETERDAELPGLIQALTEFRAQFVEQLLHRQRTAVAATELAACLTPSEEGGSHTPEESSTSHPTVESGAVDPLASYLPSIEDNYDGSHWYDEAVIERGGVPVAALLTIAGTIRARVPQDPLFWGVLGRVHEPFCHDDEELENKIESGQNHVLEARIQNGQADLLDYLNYFEQSQNLGEAFLGGAYDAFIDAVGRASAAECEALFPTLQRLEYDASHRPPRPAEEQLPVADRLWEAILAKPDVSTALVARAGLFYWLCRDVDRAPVQTLAALGKACEGDRFEYWRIPPFLPLWAASMAATRSREWDLAILCLKRALIDVMLFSQEVGRDAQDQVHAFAFDPRFVKVLLLHIRQGKPAEEGMLQLAFQFALEAVQKSELAGWSQLEFVLSELSRRLGGGSHNDVWLQSLIGKELFSKVDAETRRMLAEAEAAWASREEVLDRSTDYALIGWAYRRAIESEWRTKLGPLLSELLPDIRPDRATLRQMLEAVRNPDRSGRGDGLRQRSIGRQLVRGRIMKAVGRHSRLLDDVFLMRVSRVFESLNKAAHPCFLTRKQCAELRSELVDRRLLHDLLECVQPVDCGVHQK